MEGEPTGVWAATANRSVPSGMVIVPSSFRNAMAPIAGRLRSIAEVLLLTAEGRPEGDYNGRQFAPLAQRQSSGLLIRGSGFRNSRGARVVVVQWQNGALPRLRREFDSPLPHSGWPMR